MTEVVRRTSYPANGSTCTVVRARPTPYWYPSPGIAAKLAHHWYEADDPSRR